MEIGVVLLTLVVYGLAIFLWVRERTPNYVVALLGAHLAAFAFQRFQQRGFLTADIGASANAHFHVECVVRAQNIAAEQMLLPLGWMEMDGPTCTVRVAGLLVTEPHALVTMQS